VDPKSGNLALTREATEAIDKGMILTDVVQDIRRKPRSERPDLGAWEFDRKREDPG